MEVKVCNFKVNWKEIKNACRQTVNMGDSSVEPTKEWKNKLLICRHSPLRLGTIYIEIKDVPYYVMGHLVRHNVGVTPFVGTSREDRTGISRDERRQTDLISMRLDMNIEALMNISEKRLCTCADAKTREVWKAVVDAIREYDEEIANMCVPSCVRCGGCIEAFGNCNFYNNLMKDATMEEQINIAKRYELYNKKLMKNK